MGRDIIGREPRYGGEQRHVDAAAKADMPPDQPDRKEIKSEDMQVVAGRVIEPTDRTEKDQGQSPERCRGLVPATLRAREISHPAIKSRNRSPVNPSAPPPLSRGSFPPSVRADPRARRAGARAPFRGQSFPPFVISSFKLPFVQMPRPSLIALLLLFSVLVSGCASTRTTTVVTPPTRLRASMKLVVRR